MARHVYPVLDDFGKRGRVWRESDADVRPGDGDNEHAAWASRAVKLSRSGRGDDR